MSDLPSPELLRQLLSYDPESGILRWRERPREMFDSVRAYSAWNGRNANNVAGSVGKRGYFYVSIFKVKFSSHRIAYAIYHGHWPEGQIDHINGDKLDNKITNLRDVTHLENMKNRRLRSDSSSGQNGVCWNKKYKMWQAYIGINGKTKNLGRFKSLDDAISARRHADMKYKFHQNHGVK